MAANFETLHVNRELLNPKFDGYKLSSDKPKAVSTSLYSAVNVVQLCDDVFSHLHVKAFAWTNYLTIDHWNEGRRQKFLYLVDEKYNVQKILWQDGQLQESCVVFNIPLPEEKISHQLNAFLSFANEHIAILSDGAGHLYIVDTGDRTDNNKWSIIVDQDIGKPFTILHSHFDQNANTIGLILLSVTTDVNGDSIHIKHDVILTIVMFSGDGNDNGKFVFQMQKEFNGHSVPLYAALDSSNESVLVASETPFSLVDQTNGGHAVQDCDMNVTNSFDQPNDEPAKHMYTWNQDSDSVTILFTLGDIVKKDDIQFDVKTKSIKIAVKSGQTLLEGKLSHDVEAESCTWTIEMQRLEVTLIKSITNEQWIEVVKDDRGGIFEGNGTNASLLNEIINTKKNVDQSGSLFNQSELEECDLLPDDVLYIARMDINDGKIKQKMSLSTHQWLFTKVIDSHEPPSFCIRHDVDALIWQPTCESNGLVSWNHVGTFDAFGFVHASKKEQKFTSCSPDMSYAIICDGRNLLFTYHRHSDQDATHAKQMLLQLDDMGSDGIIGLQACDNVIFVLGRQKLFAVTV